MMMVEVECEAIDFIKIDWIYSTRHPYQYHSRVLMCLFKEERMCLKCGSSIEETGLGVGWIENSDRVGKEVLK